MGLDISEKDLKEKINLDLLKSLDNYRKNLVYMLGDAPIEALLLEKRTERILIKNGFTRIYDLFDINFAEVKGLDSTRIRDLTTRLNEFIAIC